MTDISIIMATYRQARFIKTALLSCFNQTYNNFEVIVVPVQNDKDTLRAIAPFIPPFSNLRVIPSERANYIHQRNLGVQKAKGNWYCFVDSDDFLLPAKLESDMEVAKKEDALLVYSGFLVGDERLRIQKGILPPDFSRKLLLQGCIITDFSLVNRKLYEEFGPYNEKLGEVAFYDFYLKVAEEHPERIKLNKTLTFIYRQYPEQMSRELNWDIKIKMRQKVQKESLARKPF